MGCVTVNSTCTVQLVKQCLLSTVIFWTHKFLSLMTSPVIPRHPKFLITRQYTQLTLKKFPTVITNTLLLLLQVVKYLVSSCNWRWQERGMNSVSKHCHKSVNKGLHTDWKTYITKMEWWFLIISAPFQGHIFATDHPDCHIWPT